MSAAGAVQRSLDGPWIQGSAARSPRVLVAVAAAIALHGALLIFRLDASGGRAAAPAATSAMAVRMLAPTVADSAAIAPASPSAAPTVEASQERVPTPPSKSPERLAADGPRERQGDGSSPRSSVPTDPASPSGTALSAAPDYALGSQLEPGPRPLDDIDPDYPDTVRLRSGSVVLRLLISDTGHVDEVAVVRAEPPGVFDQAAIEAFAKARFAPGIAGGRAVKSQIRIEVEFMPINRGARTSGRSY